MELVVGFVAAVGTVGLLVAASGWTPGERRPRTTRRVDLHDAARRTAIAIVAAAVALLVTGWLVAGAAAAVAGWVAVGAWRNRGGGTKAEQARVEALAAWCEQLRDLLSAEHGIVGTIEATQGTCPAAIRPDVTALATRLSRQRPEIAVRQFADDLDDPSGDLVASVLLMAMSRSSRTAALLSELATNIRDLAAMRLRVEAERSGQRSEARFIIVFTTVVVTGILVVGRGSEFLAAYDDATGQVMIALILGLFGLGVWWLGRITRFERPSRILRVGDD